ncbi:MAG TPA: hypothetical protein VHE79_09905 [Spirochaetia bacterium]
MKGGREIPGGSSDPRRIDGLTMESRGHVRTIVANTTDAGLTAVIAGGGRRCSVRMLDESNVETACREPDAYRENRGPWRAARGGEVRFNLGRYAIACIDWEV